jgi:hypothetical protein
MILSSLSSYTVNHVTLLIQDIDWDAAIIVVEVAAEDERREEGVTKHGTTSQPLFFTTVRKRRCRDCNNMHQSLTRE